MASVPEHARPLVGRDTELAGLIGLLREPGVRLVTLTGPPGVGKTSLALAAVEAFPEVVAVVDLAPVRDPDLVPAAIAGATGTDAADVDSLARSLAGHDVLLVLDNLEHLLPAAAAVAGLLATCPRLKVLATSRERLHLRAEREVPVAPLALPGAVERADAALLAATPAVAMLVERVRAYDPGFAVTVDNADALAEICCRLDGLPLALELAAPRLRLFTPGELTFRLRHRLGVLAHDASDVPVRHRTLASALTWSHDLLGPEERAMFRQLSVFAGGWTLDAAEWVCTVDDAVTTTASLVDKNLIRRTGGPGDVARFTMLESLREFSAQHLEREDETGMTRERHAEYFARLAVRIEGRVGTGDERAAIEEVGLDVGNLRAALAHDLASGRPARALAPAAALGWYSYTRGQLGEGQATLERAMAAAVGAQQTSDEALASVFVMAGAIAWARGDLDSAEFRLTEGLRLSEFVGSVRLRAIGTAFLGHVDRTRGRAAEAIARHEEAGRLHEQLANVAGVAWSRYDLGLLARSCGDPGRAAAHLQGCLAAFRDLDYGWAVACSAWALATVDLQGGRTEEAAHLLAEATARFAAAGDGRGLAQCLEATAALACARSAWAAAARLLGAAAALRRRLAAPLPEEERPALAAVARGVRSALGGESAERLQRLGQALPTSAALAVAREVLAGPTPAPPAGGGLTPREHEVARLVRRGRTNRQIGRALGISEKTTEVHVHNIIRKLGASSRAEIAAWVAARESADV